MMSSPPPHVVLFPFMSKGHTIPLLQLARLLVSRSAAVVTIFTTPANHPFVSESLSDVQVTIIDLPFPENIPGVPPGVESTDQLSDISLWIPLAKATKFMQPDFEKALRKLVPPSVTLMVTDGFLWWTVDAAIELGIPRLVYYGMGNFATTILECCLESGILKEVRNDDELVMVPNFPWVKVARNDFDSVMWEELDMKDPHFEFIRDTQISTSKSYGVLVNSFYELEQAFVDFSRLDLKKKIFCVGPLCFAEAERSNMSQVHKKSFWIEWLDEKLEQGKSVLYVAFGSQAEISSKQFQEIKNGLEKSEVNFLWVVRKNASEFKDGFEERVKGRGLVLKEWVNQREILGHQSVQGFLSHCGWGSVMESICAKVPILAWPMMAEQPLNARFVVEEVKIGIMIETYNGSIKGFVKSEGLEKSVKELMEGEMGKTVRKRAREYGEAAIRAMEEGGSSWNELNNLLIKLLE